MIIKNIHGKTLWKSKHGSVKQALEEAVKNQADLTEANLDRADLTGLNVEGAYLYKASLRKAYLEKAIFSRCTLNLADLHNVLGDQVTFFQTEMRGANLEDARLPMGIFTLVDMFEATLSYGKFQKAQFAGNLINTEFMEADLTEAVFTDSDLRNANFMSADLGGAKFKNAYLTGAFFDGANLKGVESKDSVGWPGVLDWKPSKES